MGVTVACPLSTPYVAAAAAAAASNVGSAAETAAKHMSVKYTNNGMSSINPLQLSHWIQCVSQSARHGSVAR